MWNGLNVALKFFTGLKDDGLHPLKLPSCLLLVFVSLVGAQSWSDPIQIRLGPDSNACGIILPKPLKRAPLILWLHGGMRSQRTTKGWDAEKALLPYLKPGSYYLCSPSAYAEADWLTPQGLAHVETLLNYMEKHYPVEKNRLIFVGVSDGCLGAIHYAGEGKRKPFRFILFSSHPSLAVDPNALLTDPRYTKTRWDLFQGGRDRLFPSQEVFPLLKDWAGANPKIKLHLYPEGEHDFSWYAVHAEPEIRALF